MKIRLFCDEKHSFWLGKHVGEEMLLTIVLFL
jgi:hypothetical protein